MKYKFIQEEPNGNSTIHEFSCENISDMLDRFRWFFQGCSFSIAPSEEIIIDQSNRFEAGVSTGRKVRKKTK